MQMNFQPFQSYSSLFAGTEFYRAGLAIAFLSQSVDRSLFGPLIGIAVESKRWKCN